MDFFLLNLFGTGIGIGVLAAGIRFGYWMVKGDLIGKQ